MNIESAFGRPPRWKTALPAVAVGGLALIIAMYGRWALPPQLPENYRSHLAQSEAEYTRAMKLSGMFGNSRFIDAAGERDVIFGRLASLERGSAQRYWDWAMFLNAHAKEARDRINDPAASIPANVQERMRTQVDQFENKSRDILEQLAANDSPLRAKALLRVTRDKYKNGLALYGVPKALELAKSLEAVLAPTVASEPTEHSPPEHSPPELTPEERAEAQLLWIQLKVEGAWQADVARRLAYDQSEIEDARRLAANFAKDNQSIEWLAMQRLLNAYSDDVQPSAGDTTDYSQLENPTWEQRQAAIQISCLAGDWNDVEYLLAGFRLAEDPALTIGTCRTICRLAFSPMARRSPEWSNQFNSALMLVAQRGSHLPEFAELMWECVERQVETEAAEQQPVALEHGIAPDVAKTISQGANPLFKHSIATIRAALAGETERLQSELDLLQPGRGSCFVISRTVLWRSQSRIGQRVNPAEASAPLENGEPAIPPNSMGSDELGKLIQLLQRVAEREPESGLNWIALASLQLRAEQAEAAIKSLDQAEKLLGSVALIADMKKAARELAE